MKIKVIQKGTHYVAIRDINNDVPSPCECVAEYLADIEYRLSELVRLGGNDESTAEKSSAARSLMYSVENLNNALVAAEKQNWKLELEQ